MDVFDSCYYKINKFILSCIGQWVYQTSTKKYLARTVMLLSLSTALVPQFNFLVLVWGDVDEMLECLPPLILVLLCISQIGVFLVKEKKLVDLVNCIKRDWIFWSSEKELEILRSNAENGRFFTLLYAGNVYASVFTFVSVSLTPIVLDIIIPLNESRPKLAVYPVQFPFNHDKYFSWIFFHGSLTAFYNLSVLFGCEAMLAVTIQHVCGLFEIISYRVKNTMKLVKGKRNSKGLCTEDLIYEEMIFTIEWHNHALEYARDLESFFSPFLFLTVGLNVIILSMLGIQTLNSIGNPAKVIKYGAFTSACLVHLYCISLPAQNLLDRSAKVANEAYNGCWYQIPIKSRKLLVMIIQRGQIPCKLTAAKFYTMHMVTFSGLLKTSVSYFTVLSSMQ